jgi:hypothetical protein
MEWDGVREAWLSVLAQRSVAAELAAIQTPSTGARWAAEREAEAARVIHGAVAGLRESRGGVAVHAAVARVERMQRSLAAVPDDLPAPDAAIALCAEALERLRAVAGSGAGVPAPLGPVATDRSTTHA